MKEFSKRLKVLRNEKGLTIREFAKILGITHGGYNRYENGDGEPKYEMLVKIAEYFNVSVDYLFGKDDYNP